MIAFDWQGMSMTSYQCSAATLGLGGTVIQLQAVEIRRTVIPPKKQEKDEEGKEERHKVFIKPLDEARHRAVH